MIRASLVSRLMLTGKGRGGQLQKNVTHDPAKKIRRSIIGLSWRLQQYLECAPKGSLSVTAQQSRKQGQHNSDEQRTWDMGLNQRFGQHNLGFSAGGLTQCLCWFTALE